MQVLKNEECSATAEKRSLRQPASSDLRQAPLKNAPNVSPPRCTTWSMIRQSVTTFPCYHSAEAYPNVLRATAEMVA